MRSERHGQLMNVLTAHAQKVENQTAELLFVKVVCDDLANVVAIEYRCGKTIQ